MLTIKKRDISPPILGDTRDLEVIKGSRGFPRLARNCDGSYRNVCTKVGYYICREARLFTIQENEDVSANRLIWIEKIRSGKDSTGMATISE